MQRALTIDHFSQECRHKANHGKAPVPEFSLGCKTPNPTVTVLISGAGFSRCVHDGFSGGLQEVAADSFEDGRERVVAGLIESEDSIE